jgi:hypothetical protein
MASTHNPFPGMNPFLERSWSDTHTLLIGYIRDALAEKGLPEGLRARAEEHLTVEESDETRHSARADVAVIESWKKGIPPTWSPGGEKASPVTLAEPKLVARETGVERWVEITTVHGKLVTVIEVLSPANKSGAGRIRYLSKRATYEEAGVNVVEIDLLRGGSPTVAATVGAPVEGTTRYTICVFRAAKSERFEVYHWGLRDRIPAFAVPLRPEDPDAPLDLQPLIDRAYELGYYWQDSPSPTRIDPPLDGDDATFATGQLIEAGLIEPTAG